MKSTTDIFDDEAEEFESVDCVDCEQWFDENYIQTCDGCEGYVCPKCAETHKCEIGD